MKNRSFQMPALLVAAALLGVTSGCSMSGSAETYNQNVEEHPIDGLNRNITESQTGAVHEPPSLSPPPIRPDFATDR